MKKNIISLIITFLIGIVFYYIALPPMNIHSFLFWFYWLILAFVFGFCRIIGAVDKTGKSNELAKLDGILFSSIGLIFVGIFLLNFILSPLFQSKQYAKRITVDESSTFETDVKLVDFNSLPLLDKESSRKLGDRVMGQMPELVSQFYVSDLYTQINYKNDIVRVTPLEYDGVIKYFTNRKDGVKGYILVNSVTGETTLKKLDKGMKYVPSAIFGKDLSRKLRFSYPTKIFGELTFEIDDEGKPYWIVPSIKYVGVGLKREAEGVVILNPVDGSSKYYDQKDVPTWVDHVYSADMIIEQVNDWGKYKNGYFNSIFGQKNVVATTEGYNYLAMNDDIYVYTGITSAASDEANIGFILTNLRTKETKFYSVPGAEEYSAMASAEGQVQQMSYVASFPLLINLNNRPTYLMSLKDNAGLVKMYAFVDVVDYQKVTVTDASKGIEKAAANYLEENGGNSIETEELITKEITVSSLTTSVIDGNTHYYITDAEGKKYSVSIKLEMNKLPFLQNETVVSISYQETGEVSKIIKIN